jgi:hypothetical protein
MPDAGFVTLRDLHWQWRVLRQEMRGNGGIPLSARSGKVLLCAGWTTATLWPRSPPWRNTATKSGVDDGRKPTDLQARLHPSVPR